MPRFSGFQKLLCLAYLTSFTSALNVPIPLAASSSAPKISPSLIGLSIEMDRWTDWAGTTSPNNFFHNTLDNLKQITGAPPNIRIGANSEDHANFRKDLAFSEAVFPPSTPVVPYPEASKITVGDSYYATTRFLPRNTHVTWGVNLGGNNITAAYLQTRSIVKTFASKAVKDAGIILDYLEIGNEPDFFFRSGFRPQTYNAAQWVQEWTTFAKNVSVAAGITAKSHTKFIAGSFAFSSGNDTGFSPQSAFKEGLLDSKSGKLISAISQHRYSGSFCTGDGGLLQDLMEKATIRSNLTILMPDIKATHAKGLDYILGETNSYACHGAPGVSNTAGAALWTLDYSLFATQLGIPAIHFHSGIGYKYNLIQPVTLTRSTLDGSELPSPVPAHVQPQYYAAIIVAEAIGKTGSSRIQELVINHPQISGYAVYEGKRLVRAVLINSKAYLSASSKRTSVHLDLGFTGRGAHAPVKMTVKRLAIKLATDVTGLTWGGRNYETRDGRVAGSLRVETALVAKGVDIKETEAVLLTFQ